MSRWKLTVSGVAIAVLALAAVLVSPAMALALQPGTSIYGVVTDAKSGQPISGAFVTATSVETGEDLMTTSDSLGRYELAAPSGPHDVSCYVSSRYEQESALGVVADSVTPASVNFVLTPYDKAFYGTVSDQGTAQRIASAAVSIKSGDGLFNRMVTTNSSGEYEVYAPAGTYEVTFAAAGYTSSVVADQVFSSTPVQLNASLTPLPKAVYGTVTNASTHGPVAGALVTLSWTVPDPQPDDPDNVEYFQVTTTSNASGGYEFRRPAGTYKVSAAAFGFAPSPALDAVFDGSHALSRDFELAPKVKSFTGTVVEDGTDTPIVGATVTVTGTFEEEPFEVSTVTDSQGDYTIYVEPGTYDIEVSSPGYLPKGELDLAFDGVHPVVRDFSLQPSGTDTIKPTTTISGVPAVWGNSDVTFELDASDLGGAGVAATYYQLGSGDIMSYADPVTVTDEGATIVTYWSVDAAANRENNKTATIRIDKTLPSTGSNAVSAYVGSATIALSPSDTGGSALKATKWRLDGSAWTSGTSISTSAVGAHTLQFFSEDYAGNSETPKTVNFTVSPAAVVPAPTVLAIQASTTAPKTYGQSVTLTGALRQSSGAGVPYATVVVQTYSTSTGTWTTAATVTTTADGSVTWTVKPTSATTYRFSFAGTAAFGATGSAGVKVVPKAYLSKVATARYAARAYKLTGTLKPKHKAGTYPVRVYRWKKVGGKWVAKGYIKAKASDYKGNTRFTVKYKFPSKGSWRLQAVAPADSSHQTSKSAYTYFTVK